ncbi:unnamed protein product [Cuscuta campestris]|uniref:Elongin-A n=1 Tax=Cuscuta campestris TaxID=132261 RepID=A0A484L6S1_9ASTE|nr:unnamed protein product [Cuscuta campestris]
MSCALVNHNVPSLVDLCVQIAIRYVRYLDDVGETDYHLLDRILPHCNIDQLARIERSTEGRDLSPVTDKLWKRFYERQFGENNTNHVEKMMRKGKTYLWKHLYEAKFEQEEEAKERSFERIKYLYKKQEAEKQNRQIKICTKIPPSKCKRSFYGGGSNVYNTKSTVMKKAKLDYLKSPEFKNLAALKNKAVQRTSSVFSPKKPDGRCMVAALSTPKPVKRPLEIEALKPMKRPLGIEALKPMKRPLGIEALKPMKRPLEIEALKPMKKPAMKEAAKLMKPAAGRRF